MVKILAETPARDLRFEIAAGRGDDPHVDIDLAGAADALEGLVDQHPQNLVLRLARHVGDLVDEQTAAMRLLERADLARLAAVRLLDAEQFDLHALGGDGGGVDDDEWPLRAFGEIMDRARGEFLARSR